MLISHPGKLSIPVEYYPLEEKTPISPPDAVVVRQHGREGPHEGLFPGSHVYPDFPSCCHVAVPPVTNIASGRPRSLKGTFLDIDPAQSKGAVQNTSRHLHAVNGSPKSARSDLSGESPRPPTYYSTARGQVTTLARHDSDDL